MFSTFRSLAYALLALWPAAAFGQNYPLPGGATNVTEEVRFYHSDALGSVRAVSNMAGGVEARYDYLPYGEQIATNLGRSGVSGYGGEAGNKQKFTGKERDDESHLDYFGARYYSGAQGRFISVDPAVNRDRTILEPQLWNRYAYVGNNPVKYVDPDGNERVDAILGRDALAVLSGSMSVREYNDRNAARAAGVAFAGAAVLGGPSAIANARLFLSNPGAALRGLWATAVGFMASPQGQEAINAVGEGLSPVPLGFSPIKAAENFGLRGIETAGDMAMGRLANGAEIGARFSRAGGTLSVDVIAAYNANRGDAAGTLRAILSGALNAARAEGATSLELSGVAVGNARLAEVLRRQGFAIAKKTIDGVEYMAYSKTIEVVQ